MGTSSYASTEFIDVTTADVFLGEVWSQKCTVAREQALAFASAVDRDFEKELSKGQKIWIGEISNLAARSKTANSAISYETVTESVSSITVSSYYYAAFAVEDIIKVQSMVKLREKYMGKLGYALALQEDDTLAALIDDGTITSSVGTLIAALTDDNLIRADQYLNDASVPQADRHIIISPAEKGNFLKMDKFVHMDYGRTGAPVATGQIGNIYGCNVIVTPNVDGTNAAGHDNVMMHREALAMISQLKAKTESQRDIDYLCDKVVASELFGVGIIREDHAVWMAGA